MQYTAFIIQWATHIYTIGTRFKGFLLQYKPTICDPPTLQGWCIILQLNVCIVWHTHMHSCLCMQFERYLLRGSVVLLKNRNLTATYIIILWYNMYEVSIIIFLDGFSMCAWDWLWKLNFLDQSIPWFSNTLNYDLYHVIGYWGGKAVSRVHLVGPRMVPGRLVEGWWSLHPHLELFPLQFRATAGEITDTTGPSK